MYQLYVVIIKLITLLLHYQTFAIKSSNYIIQVVFEKIKFNVLPISLPGNGIPIRKLDHGKKFVTFLAERNQRVFGKKCINPDNNE